MLFQVTKSNPWYANVVNFMVAGYVPLGEDKRKLVYESHLYIWDAPYLLESTLIAYSKDVYQQKKA
jgi:hypothetical protein